jgi:RNA polymerase sigma-70 factor, ECF subfamily
MIGRWSGMQARADRGAPIGADQRAQDRDPAPDREAREREARELYDAALVADLRGGDPSAWERLIDRYGPQVERLVASALGVDSDLADIVQDVFVHVIERVHQLRRPAALGGWIASVAVFTARGHIRRRQRWRWIRFFAPSELPEAPAATAGPEGYALLRATHRVLDALPPDERIAFSLRFVAEMELTEVAGACGCSLATIKRRLARAEKRFVAEAQQDPLLRERIDRGERWRGE